MPPLLGEARVIDDPSFNRPVALYRRQHHLADLGQNLLVGPVAFAYKMQQRLMLRRRPFRRCNRRHWLDALSRARHHQPHAIIAKRLRSAWPITFVRPSTYAENRDAASPDLGRPISAPRMLKSESRQIHDSSQQQPRPSDSVRLGPPKVIVAQLLKH